MKTMDLPKAIGLWSTQGDHAGVMLLAPSTDGSSGECIFMLSPVSIAGVESDMGVIVSELKIAGEHKFKALRADNGFNLTVCPVGLPEIELRLNHQFKGNVFTTINSTSRCVGSAEPLQGRA